MTLVVQKEVPSIIIITALLCAFCVFAGSRIKKADPYEKPKGIVFAALWLIEWVDGTVESMMGKGNVKAFGPYIGSLAMYLICANLSGLFGFNTPTMNLSVTLSLASITWALIQWATLKANGVGGYVKGLFEPIPLLAAHLALHASVRQHPVGLHPHVARLHGMQRALESRPGMDRHQLQRLRRRPGAGAARVFRRVRRIHPDVHLHLAHYGIGVQRVGRRIGGNTYGYR